LIGEVLCRQKMGEEMRIPREAVLLRIFFGENDRFQRLPLHEAIVLKAREMHLGGATVLRGHIGFGHSSRIHTSKSLRLSQDLPVVVEIVDSQEKIDRFLPVLDGMMSSGLITIERAEVLQYGTEEARPLQAVEPEPRSQNLKV
jgi:PII-like signaling protein